MITSSIASTSNVVDADLRFTTDLAGGLERGLQAVVGAPVLFFNGAEGDIGPRRGQKNDDRDNGNYLLDLTFSAAVNLYVFMDNRVVPPQWLIDQGFADTGLDIGVDESGDATGPGSAPRIAPL